MSKKNVITRREAVSGSIAAATGIVLASAGSADAGCGSCGSGKKHTHKVAMPENKDFYDADGKFLPEKARQAYYAMFERFGYPNPEPQQKGMWVHDFGMGDFVHAGMAGIFWFNDKENSYFGHDIYLLPGQQIPEHKHMKTKDAVAKMESWHVRHGMIHCLGEGKETKPMPIKLPKSQEKHRTVKNAVPVLPGEVNSLNRAEAFHFMIAGPEGAIVTEYATYHDGNALVFANPNAKL
jgi:D-lyxose ketol-isomerase